MTEARSLWSILREGWKPLGAIAMLSRIDPVVELFSLVESWYSCRWDESRTWLDAMLLAIR